MPAKTTRISFHIPIEELESLEQHAANKHKSKSELIRGFIKQGLIVGSYKDDIDFVRKQINEELRHVLMPQVERLVKINVKSGITSAAGFFLAAKLLATFVHESHRRDFEETTTESKKEAIAYFKLRDYEVNQFMREDNEFFEGITSANGPPDI